MRTHENLVASIVNEDGLYTVFVTLPVEVLRQMIENTAHGSHGITFVFDAGDDYPLEMELDWKQDEF